MWKKWKFGLKFATKDLSKFDSWRSDVSFLFHYNCFAYFVKKKLLHTLENIYFYLDWLLYFCD